MYIQITSRCNMSCEHCCMSCEPGKGEDMSMKVFMAALEMAEDYDAWITLGGGEPTLHPNFKLMLIEAMAIANSEEMKVTVITNGSITKTALFLARLGKVGAIYADLSLDRWHDPIDFEVVSAFKNNIRRHEPHDVKPQGRGAEMLDYADEDLEARTGQDCACDSIFIAPDGTIKYCGCDDSPIIGNVFDGIKIPYSEVEGCFRYGYLVDEDEPEMACQYCGEVKHYSPGMCPHCGRFPNVMADTFHALEEETETIGAES
jgi:MoaA/NifB/PqqE/SkfB family radical SAM enzyme